MTGSSASASAALGSTSLDADVVFPFATSASSQAETPATVAPASPQITMPAPTPTSTSVSSLRTPAPSPPPDSDRERGDKPLPPPGSDDCRSGSKESPEELLERRRTTGTCGFYPSKFKECAEPRSCYDCLNFVVQGEDGGCMLTDYGRCVPARNHYTKLLDYTRFTPANANRTRASSAGSGSAGSLSPNVGEVGSVAATCPLLKTWAHFRADTTHYCERADALCKDCRRSVFADYIENETRSGGNQFCLGTGGCVCIATCEARRDRPPPNNKDCFAKALAVNRKENKAAGTGGMDSVVAILGAMVFVVVTVFAIYRIRTRGERRSRHDSIDAASNSSSNNNNSSNMEHTAAGAGDVSQSHAVATPDASASPSNTVMVTVTSTTAKTGSRLLNLFGWQAMRDDLVHKEHMRLAGVEPTSPLKQSNVQLIGVEPSAPEIDAAMPTAPMAAMAIPIVPMAMMASAPMAFSVRATASAPDYEDMDDVDVDVL